MSMGKNKFRLTLPEVPKETAEQNNENGYKFLLNLK